MDENKEQTERDLQRAQKYRKLQKNTEYRELVEEPLIKIRARKIKEMLRTQCSTAEEYGIKFVEFRTDIKRIDSLITAPEKFFKAEKGIHDREKEGEA